MKIERGTATYAEILPALKKAFHQNFVRLEPKVYLHPQYQKDHFVARGEGGKLLGALLSYPLVLKVNEHTLHGRGIGNVGVLPAARGQGVMSALLKQSIAQASADGADFMVLGGHRQRYQNYGFELFETEVKFCFIKENFKQTKDEPYTFAPLQKNDPSLATLEALHQAQPVRYDRPHFLDTLHNWGLKNILVVSQSGKTVGYLVCGGMVRRGCLTVHECVLKDEASILPVLKALQTKYHFSQIRVAVAAAQHGMVDVFKNAAESYQVEANQNLLVLRYQNLLTALVPLCPANLVADYQQVLAFPTGEVLELVVKNGVFSCRPTTQPPHTTLKKLGAETTLFSPLLAASAGLPFVLGGLVNPTLDRV